MLVVFSFIRGGVTRQHGHVVRSKQILHQVKQKRAASTLNTATYIPVGKVYVAATMRSMTPMSDQCLHKI